MDTGMGTSVARYLRVWGIAVLCSVGLAACANPGLGAESVAAEQETFNESLEDDAGIDLATTSQGLEAPAFCWKGSYGRGAGTVPNTCPGQQEDAGLCYNWCASGYYGVGPVCWQSCPAGYTDDGATCRRDAQIIGANNSKCPWYDTCGVTFAKGCSTCPAGFTTDGCTCRRDVHIFGKASYGRGAGAPRQCNSALDADAGLCYNKCNSGYDGVGPVCWGYCPAETPIACAAGCAVSEYECAKKIISQMNASFEVAANIGSMAMSLGASAGFKFATKQALSAAQKQTYREFIKEKLKDRISDAADLVDAADTVISAAEGELVSVNDLDPTGIAALVEAFNAPSCSSLVINKARGKSATQSSTGWDGDAARAVDGNTNGVYGGNSVTHTNSDAAAWWKVDLGSVVPVGRVVVFNRAELPERLSSFHVDLLDTNGNQIARRDFSGTAGQKTSFDFAGAKGRFVRVQLHGTNPLSLAEVEVY